MADAKKSDSQIKALLVSDPEKFLNQIDTMSISQYKADLYRALSYNELRQFALKEKFARKALESKEINKHLSDKLQAMTMLISTHSFYSDYGKSIALANEAIKLAREIENRPAEFNILLSMADASFNVGNKRDGYEYINRIISAGEKSENVRELANVSAAYGRMVIELYADENFLQALSESRRRLAIIDRIDKIGGAPDGFTDQQRAYTYARMASSAYKAGDFDAASDAYEKFNKTHYGQLPYGKAFITDYLLESHQYSVLLGNLAPIYHVLHQADTINDDYRSVLYSTGKAHIGLGNFQEGADYIQRAMAIQDSLYARERKSNANELATVFQLNEKALEIERSKAESRQRQIFLIIVVGIGVMVLMALIVLWIQYTATKKRNRIAVARIDEIMSQRNLLRESAKYDEGIKETEYDRFLELERDIIEKKFFLQQDTSRENLAEQLGLPRMEVVRLIKDHTGCTPNDYINRLRVEYSIQMIKEHPEWTIDAIAEASGYMNRGTYYNNFNRLCGMSPAQYRKQTIENGE